MIMTIFKTFVFVEKEKKNEEQMEFKIPNYFGIQFYILFLFIFCNHVCNFLNKYLFNNLFVFNSV